MKERPILFSGSMVRAILEDKKTQTRRVVKPQPERKPVPCHYVRSGWSLEGEPNQYGVKGCSCREVRCHYQPGDRLYVKENFKIEHFDEGEENNGESGYELIAEAEATVVYEDGERNRVVGLIYNAGDNEEINEIEQAERLSKKRICPSIHMPRWASRITLEIVSVRVERVQDITEEDAIYEGMVPQYDHDSVPEKDATEMFQDLWNSINEKRGAGWDANPWVWVIEFKKI